MQSTIVTRTIREAIKLLDATHVKYVVVDLEGNEYAKGLEIQQPKSVEPKRKKVAHREYGAIAQYYQPYIKTLKVGEVAVIPLGPFKAEKDVLRNAITAWCVANWGKNSYKSCITDNAVEVLRAA